MDLPEADRAQLDALCRELEQQKLCHGEVFGLWRDRPEGSLELQQALRQEWDAP
ncbi:MAG: hypothetical protein ACK5RA_00560 [Cyanobacteriota bacterium]